MREKMLQNTKTYALLMILTVLVGTILLTPGLSSLMGNVTIRNSGKIITTTISPLHVDGRYIKNSLNQTVILKGVNKPMFEDDPDGVWMGSTMWTDNNVKAELDAMKSWGVNVIRCFISVELMKFDIGPNSGHPASSRCAISAREAVRRLLTFAAERGIYVIIVPWTVRCYYTGAEQDPLPFPPYQTSQNAEEVIASVDEFVDFWRDMAIEYRSYPNVIFDFWNEPNPANTQENFQVWLNATQHCITAVRQEGFSGIILFEWRNGPYCNVYSGNNFPIGYAAGGETLGWVEDAIEYLEDPLGNLAIDAHIYRLGGGTGQLWTDPALEEYWNSSWAYNYTQVKMCLEYMKYKWVGETLNVPLIVGEIGATLGWLGSDPTQHQYEMTAFGNVLDILNEWNIGFIGFWWRESGVYRLHNGPPNFNPTDTGQILKAYLLAS